MTVAPKSVSDQPVQESHRTRRISVPRTSIQESLWPALPNQRNALILALMYQFDQCEWWRPQALQTLQFTQARPLLLHAAETSPFYRNRLEKIVHDLGDRPLNREIWHKIPVLERADLQQAGDDIFSTAPPKSHGEISEIRTSGSTGRAVTIRSTAITGAYFQAYNLRYHLWHQRDFGKHVAAIRVVTPELAEKNDLKKGLAWVPAHPSAPLYLLDIRNPVRAQLDWLKDVKPHMLVTYPSNLEALLAESRKRKLRIPNLGEISTMGEHVSPRLRRKCAEIWGARLTDIYSCQEVGIMAIQAPDAAPENPYYLVMAENRLVAKVRLF